MRYCLPVVLAITLFACMTTPAFSATDGIPDPGAQPVDALPPWDYDAVKAKVLSWVSHPERWRFKFFTAELTHSTIVTGKKIRTGTIRHFVVTRRQSGHLRVHRVSGSLDTVIATALVFDTPPGKPLL